MITVALGMSLFTRKHVAASLGPFPKRSSCTPTRNQRYYTKQRNDNNNYIQQTGISRRTFMLFIQPKELNYQNGDKVVRANLIVTFEDYDQAVVN